MTTRLLYRQLIALIFLSSLIAQTFNKSFVIADYYVNTASFAKNCENKAKPMLHCNGKCQMLKKLKQQENKDQQNPERKTDNKSNVLSSRSFFFSFPLLIADESNKSYNNFANQKEIKRSLAIFHPPDRHWA